MIKIVSVNDIYELEPNVAGNGGVAQLCTFFRKEKEGIPGPCLFLIPGDFLSASHLAEKARGMHMIDALNEFTGLDLVCCPGNHEFDFSAEVLSGLIERSRFLWLNSNVRLSGSGELLGVEQGARDWVVRSFEFGALGVRRVALFAVCTADTPMLSHPGPSVQFGDVFEATERVLGEIKAFSLSLAEGEGQIDLIVALTHLSLAEDRRLLRMFPRIDLAFGGHDHSVVTWQERNAFLFKAGKDAERAIVVDCDLSAPNPPSAPSIEWRYALVRGEADAVVRMVLEDYEHRYLDVAVPMALLELPMSSTGTRVGESTMANLLVDAMATELDADLALMNGGFVRRGMDYPAGHVLTDEDVRREMPFPCTPTLLELSAEDLWGTLEDALSHVQDQLGHFPHLSRGWSLVFDGDRPPGARVMEVSWRGEPLPRESPARIRVATSSYLAHGGDGFAHFSAGQRIDTPFREEIIQKVVIKHLLSLPKEASIDVDGENCALPILRYVIEGRIIPFNNHQ